MSSVIRIDAVTKRFGSVVAVDNVSLDIARSEFVVLMGPSGSGKSTLLHIIAGLIRPDRGRITLDGETLVDTARGIDVESFTVNSYANRAG